MASAADIVRTAEAEVGVCETPSGSNCVKYNTEYYGRAVSGTSYPWCAVFVWWVFKHSDASELYFGGDKSASCPTLMSYYKRKGQLVKSGYQPGDIVFFNFSGGTNPVHVGIVQGVNGSVVSTIEGNTSLTSNDNGGRVMIRERRFSQIVGAGRPEYEEDDMKRFNTIAEIQKDAGYAVATINKLIAEGLLKGGDAGLNLSEDMIRIFVINDRAGLYDR